MSETLTRTVCVKLDVGEHSPELAATQAAFNEAASWIASVCWDEHITNTNTAHHRVYGETRARFGLGAQLACCARAKAVEAIKAGKAKGRDTCPTFGPRGSTRYDARTYRLMALDRVSLNTLSGRVVCQLVPGARQRPMLVDLSWTIGGADLVWRDGVYFFHLTQTREAPETDGSGGVLGVDLGQVKLAVDSDGTAFSGAKVKGVRHYYARRRAILQAVGTRSATRRLKIIKRRESRFMRDTNHVIAKTLVEKATTTRKALALEDLTGIRERVTVRRAQRSYRMSWAFSQLRQQIAYKAATAGVPVVLVDPRNTSRTCHVCGHCEKANRHSQASFLCRSCGFSCCADLNAAVNIAYRAVANQPMVPSGQRDRRGTSPRL
jgi:putative transposase